MEERKLRYGLIGCGMIARVKHMKGVAAHSDEAEVVAFCDIIPERAKNYAREYGTKDAKVYTDYKELLKDETIDAVIAVSYTHLIGVLCGFFAELGKYFFDFFLFF